MRTSKQKRQKKVYDMHKLVQEAARYRLRKCEDETKGQAYFAKAAFHTTNRLFPDTCSKHRDYLSLDTRWDVWERCEQYLAHAQQAGTWAELHKGEVEVAELLLHVFQYLLDRGRVKEMEPVIKMVVDFHQKLLGEQHRKTINTISGLGVTYSRQGKYEEAEKLHRQALELHKEVLGRRHPDTLISMSNLSTALNNQGKYEEAEKLHRQTLELHKEVLGRRHPGTLISMYKLASVLQNQGRHEEAEEITKGLPAEHREGAEDAIRDPNADNIRASPVDEQSTDTHPLGNARPDRRRKKHRKRVKSPASKKRSGSSCVVQ
ncbi:hypothetical protein CIB48_g9195 [Xylaria polymorpha]|nr:hypothetical protein CIB48_g9195 [Xylaria polymorpha]